MTAPEVVVPNGTIVCYCPHCGAYLFAIDRGEVKCDQCGQTFVIREEPTDGSQEA